MKKIYLTKTGVELRLIQGGGQGDGVSYGDLRLVTEAMARDLESEAEFIRQRDEIAAWEQAFQDALAPDAPRVDIFGEPIPAKSKSPKSMRKPKTQTKGLEK